MIHYALGFAFNVGLTQVALIEKLKPDWQKGKLNGIGGKVNNFENYNLAMVREFEEETGVKTQEGEWRARGVIYRPNDLKCSVYSTVLPLDRFLSIRTMEAEKVCLFPLDELYRYRYRLIDNLLGLVGLCMIDPASAPFFHLEYE